MMLQMADDMQKGRSYLLDKLTPVLASSPWLELAAESLQLGWKII